MVRSRLDPSINYIELKALDPLDTKERNYKAPLYEASVLGINTIISIGNIKNTFISQNIVYYPIYLIKNDKVVSQIGVYEIFQNDIPSLLDDDGDINIEKAPPPLLYSFVKKSLIQQAIFIPKESDIVAQEKKTKQPSLKMKSLSRASLESIKSQIEKAPVAVTDPTKDEDVDEDEEQDAALKAAIIASLLPQKSRLSDLPLKRKNIPLQTLEQSLAENKAYRHAKDESWIQSYYHNNNFNTVRNEGGGDCLFIAICQAFLTIDPDSDISVIQLRRMLADVMTDEEFKLYRSRYDMFADTLKGLAAENKKLSEENRKLAERAAAPNLTASDKLTLKFQSEENIARNKEILREIEMYKEYLKPVYFMKGVRTLEALQAIVRKGEMTSEYWGDEWAVATLEIILNVKLIILSNRDYIERGRKPYTESNIVICNSNPDDKRRQEIEDIIRGKAARGLGDRDSGAAGDAGDKSKMQGEKPFTPDYYIILSHTGGHYELVTYRDTGIFTFPEIPFCIKLQIVNRCIETSSGSVEALSGSYRRIPQFVMFYEHELGLGNIGKSFGQGGGGSADANHVLTANPHFDPSIVLIYHAESADELPGNAQGDYVSMANKNGFLPLIASGKGKNNWRKKLSNEWNSPFTLDGHRWLSVEHYYQANKFFKRHPEFYLLFTMDGNKKSKYYQENSILSQISHDVNLAKIAGKKIPRTIIDGKKVMLRPDEIVIDPEFFNGTNTRVLEKGTMAKFEQNDELAKVLLMTNNAKLVNYVFSKPPTISYHLMRVRSKLRTKKGGVNVFEIEES
jgi:predicted NAD-dependent protein-ADP-ribosyltransferase YbiA (DUF1768 family)